MKQLKPLPGFMIVKLESLFKDDNFIHIPERFKKAPHLVGTITSVNMRKQDRAILGTYLFAGMRILVTPLGGRYLAGDTWIYPITLKRKDERGKKYNDSGVLAIIGTDVELKPHIQDVERCQHCGEANSSKQNMIMFSGRCPRCGKNRQGDYIESNPSITESEADAVGEVFKEKQAKAWEARVRN